MSAPGSELLRLTGRGHHEIRATHDRTLELTADTDITGRATCVLGVGAVVEGSAPPGIAGPVEITISAGGASAVVRAVANSAWRPGGSAVVRRSGVRLANTMATDADTTARDLPRSLALALADPAVAVEVVVRRGVAEGPVLVLFRSGDEARLAAERAAADVVVVGERGWDAGLSALGGGGRVLAVDAPGFAAAALESGDRPSVEVLGMAPELAVAAVCGRRVPVVVAGALGKKDLARVVSAYPAAVVVFRVAGAGLAGALDAAVKAVGTRVGAVGVDERPVWGAVEELRGLEVRGEVWCALEPVVEEVGGEVGVPEGFIAGLLGQGVSATSVVKALAGVPGWSRRRAYDEVLRVSGK
ncbi:DUF371 domain-containing protein [Actinokineospora sp. G85]|uniref:DUF371 domain-containing protein n=1 Tax=Actinokineospora sp. G85 TaxID=3406626 RepID=UPI003C774F02